MWIAHMVFVWLCKWNWSFVADICLGLPPFSCAKTKPGPLYSSSSPIAHKSWMSNDVMIREIQKMDAIVYCCVIYSECGYGSL